LQLYSGKFHRCALKFGNLEGVFDKKTEPEASGFFEKLHAEYGAK